MNSLFVFIFSFIICNAYAFKFSPMSITINPSSGERSTVAYLENDSSSPIAIQITLARREMDVNGNETYPEANDELQAYPSQMIIPPYEKKSVKVTYTGKEIGEVEKAFRIISEQLPIEVDKKVKKKTNVKILLKYIAALYVENGKTEANVKLNAWRIQNKEIELSIKNDGNKHQVLTNLSIVFSKDGEKIIIIEPKDLKNISGENILAKSERIFKIPLTSNLNKIDAKFKVELKFEKDN
jgi:fimbrial chaperone protein